MKISLIQQFWRSIVSLIYPPLCLHCEMMMHDDQHLFCEGCQELLDPINPAERCPYCFHVLLSEQRVCSECFKKPVFNRMASVFDYVGPAATLVKKLKYGDQPYLAKGAGGYLVTQWLQLDWPKPDVIIPVPSSFTRLLERGYNQSELLAQQVSMIIDVPMQNILIRRSGDYSQTALHWSQRKQLSGSNILLKEKHGIEDKCVLLIDDVMTTGSTMRRCAETLLEGCPNQIYGLTVCRAIT